jgi:hypothetical protein
MHYIMSVITAHLCTAQPGAVLARWVDSLCADHVMRRCVRRVMLSAHNVTSRPLGVAWCSLLHIRCHVSPFTEQCKMTACAHKVIIPPGCHQPSQHKLIEPVLVGAPSHMPNDTNTYHHNPVYNLLQLRIAPWVKRSGPPLHSEFFPPSLTYIDHLW